MSHSVWQLEGSTATLGGTDWSVDTARPGNGLRGRSLGGESAAVLAIGPSRPEAEPLQLAEVYTRGVDLIADYAPTENFPFHTELYWRAERTATNAATRLTLIVSVRTDLLDTWPLLSVCSRLEGSAHPLSADDSGVMSSVDETRATAVLVTGNNLSWFEAVHPSDRTEALLDCEPDGGGSTSHWRLFSQFLEKGVIRRARVTAALLSAAEAEGSLAQAAELHRLFAEAEPPLTV